MVEWEGEMTVAIGFWVVPTVVTAVIAAAPELLAALEKAVERQGFTNDELLDARALIAKAKGGNK